MSNTTTVVTEHWVTTKRAAEVLNRDIRTVQKMAASGLLKWKNAPGTNARLYEAADLDRYLRGEEAKPAKVANEESRLKVRDKPQQQEARALDTVSIVGNLVAGHKAEMEMLVGQMAKNLEFVTGQLAKNLESVARLILASHEKQFEAEHERIKADRIDARERWEMERQDRLERRNTKTKTVLASVN